MYRTVSVVLDEWKKNPYRKPLILQGARQVGKTYSLLDFARSKYDNVAYFNFETDPSLSKTFDESLDPDYLIPILSRISSQTITKERTIMVFDEVQVCERALTSLKYFCEKAPEYHIAVAGSLLGVAANRKKVSFPVGKVDIVDMYPMDFEEFLMASGEDSLIADIKRCFLEDAPMPSAMHEAALDYYRRYLVVGRMPECVDKYRAVKDLVLVRHAQDNILLGYLNDLRKYNSENEIKKTRLVYDNMTAQLSKANTRFKYKMLKQGARASEFENAIEWLVLSGIVNRVFKVENPIKPLENYRDIDSFKMYFSDVGLLCAKANVLPEDIIYPTDALDDFKGALAENYVCCQLKSNGYASYFWSSKRGAEVDFIIQRQGDVIPVEVKSSDNTRARSLVVYKRSYMPEYAIKLSTRNFGMEGSTKTVPLYAAFCI